MSAKNHLIEDYPNRPNFCLFEASFTTKDFWGKICWWHNARIKLMFYFPLLGETTIFKFYDFIMKIDIGGIEVIERNSRVGQTI